MIGFHSFEYARNFFTTCKRLLGVNFEYRRSGQMAIDYHGRDVSLIISHIGVSYDSIYKQVVNSKFKSKIKATQRSKRFVILSLDIMNQIAGIKEKLLGYQMFLQSNPAHAKNCRLIQYVEPPAYGKKYKAEQYKNVIMKIKDEIVKEFGHKVISIKVESLKENFRLLLWARTDMFLNCALRGGIRLLSLEYIAVRCILQKQSKSCIVISEFAEGAKVLSGAIKFNPYSRKATSSAIERGYNMRPKEKSSNMSCMINDVIKHSTQQWANQFIKDIKSGHNQMESSLFLGFTSEAVKHRLIHQSNTKPLNLKDIKAAYDSTMNRLIIIDTKGIVMPKNQGGIMSYETNSFELSGMILRLLDSLSVHEQNKFWIISPYRKEKITEGLKSLEKSEESSEHGLGVAAEDGQFYTWDLASDHWEQLIAEVDNSWIEEVTSCADFFRPRESCSSTAIQLTGLTSRNTRV